MFTTNLKNKEKKNNNNKKFVKYLLKVYLYDWVKLKKGID